MRYFKTIFKNRYFGKGYIIGVSSLLQSAERLFSIGIYTKIIFHTLFSRIEKYVKL